MIKVREKLGKLCGWLCWASIITTFFMMCVTTLDVLGRKLGIYNINGSYEIVEVSMVIITFMAVADNQVKHGHIKVDMFTNKFPYHFRKILSGVMLLAEAILYGAMTVVCIQKIMEMTVTPLYTGILRLPYIPFYIILVAGTALYVLILLADAIIDFLYGVGVIKENEKLS